MNLWIFVVTALFTPVVEPLGLATEQADAAAFVAPTTPLAVAASIDAEPRFHGLERALAEIDAR